MKILVTGVAGFLGSHLAQKLSELGHVVVGVDNMIGGYKDNIPKNIEFFENYKHNSYHKILSPVHNYKNLTNACVHFRILGNGFWY